MWRIQLFRRPFQRPGSTKKTSRLRVPYSTLTVSFAKARFNLQTKLKTGIAPLFQRLGFECPPTKLIGCGYHVYILLEHVKYFLTPSRLDFRLRSHCLSFFSRKKMLMPPPGSGTDWGDERNYPENSCWNGWRCSQDDTDQIRDWIVESQENLYVVALAERRQSLRAFEGEIWISQRYEKLKARFVLILGHKWRKRWEESWHGGSTWLLSIEAHKNICD